MHCKGLHNEVRKDEELEEEKKAGGGRRPERKEYKYKINKKEESRKGYKKNKMKTLEVG